MATPQPIALTGVYTSAPGAQNLEDNLPARAYPYNIAWTSDAGYMVSNSTAWVSIAAFAAPTAIGTPNTRTVAFATAYQATNVAKPAVVSIIIECVTSISIGSAANTVELIIGSTNAVASGTGTLADTYRSDLSVTLISLNFTGRQALQTLIPAGWYFAVRRTVGTGMSVISAFDQAVG